MNELMVFERLFYGIELCSISYSSEKNKEKNDGKKVGFFCHRRVSDTSHLI